MSNLENFIKFEAVSSTLPGNSCLSQQTKATTAGLNWLAVPSSSKCVGLVYRYNNNSLEAIRIAEDADAQVISSIQLPAPVVNIASSSDGRFVAVCLSDGSLHCLDSTTSGFHLRWKIPNAHSHIVSDVQNTVNKSRQNAAGAAGPVRTLQFHPNGYALILVDSGICKISIYHADVTTEPVDLATSINSNLLASSATWISLANNSECALAIGLTSKSDDKNASIHIYIFDTVTSKLSFINEIPFPGNQDEDEVGWTCTHLEWIQNVDSLAAGYCRVTGSDDETDENDDDDEDEDDTAEHEALMCLIELHTTTFTIKQSTELGDIVPFFAIPKHGRHVFFSTVIPTQQNQDLSLLMVTTNVGTEVELLCKENDESWQIMDLPEGCKLTMLTDEDDEFLYPTGLGCILVSKQGSNTAVPCIVLASTNSFLATRRIIHTENKQFLEVDSSSHFEQLSSDPVPANNQTQTQLSEPELVNETPAVAPSKEIAFGSSNTIPSFGTGGFSFNFQSTTTESSTATKPFGLATTQPLFGQTATLFGAQSSSNNTFSFGTPVKPTFGIPSSSPFGTPAAPIFGSGTATPVFGLTTSTQSSFGGFAQLAQANAGNNAFGKQVSKADTDWSSVSLPTPTNPTATITDNPNQSDNSSDEYVYVEHEKANDEVPVDMTNPAAKTAAQVFDSFDKEGTLSLPTLIMEDLLDEIGEGFHGAELDGQIALIDPTKSGKITRSAFISWYVKLVSSFEGQYSSDGASLDSEERAEREEEKEKAVKHFLLLAKSEDDKSYVSVGDVPKYFMSLSETDQDKIYISVSDFPKLMESMKTTYCEEEHVKTIKRISRNGETILLKDFLDWYVDWLFGDDSSDEGSETESDDKSETRIDTKELTTTGWGSTFKLKEGSWKCEVCMVQNDGDKNVCAACETPKPGQVATKNQSGSGTTSTGFGSASIGAGGFSFLGASTAKVLSEGNTAPPAFTLQPSSGFTFTGTNSLNSTGFSFGTSTANTPVTTRTAPLNVVTSPAPSKLIEKSVSDLKSEVATRAFNHFDEEGTGFLPMEKIEDLLDGIGEDFHGDDLQKQKKLIDPAGAGKIEKSSFVSWYVKLTSGNNVIDSTETPKLDAMKEKATKCFMALKSSDSERVYVINNDFPKLLQSLDIPLDKDEESKAVKFLTTEDGKIYLESFLDWVVTRMFNRKESESKESLTQSSFKFLGISDKGSAQTATQASSGTPKIELDQRAPLSFEPNKIANNEESEIASKAGRVFDSFDKLKSGILPVSTIDDLMDELGGGFYGDELDAQLELMDPEKTGKILRNAFIKWYVGLVAEEESDDNKSIDSEEQAERDEEREKAKSCFMKFAKGENENKFIMKTDFPKLIESMDTTYCEEEHVKTIKRLTDSEGKIYLDNFLSWYIDWLFGGDEDSEDEYDNDEEDTQDDKIQTSTTLGWGSTFKKKEGSWQCKECLVSNDADVTSCAACTTPRPGITDPKTAPLATASNSSIGAGGFSFNLESNANQGAKAQGFTFAGSALNSNSTAGSTTTIGFGSVGFSFGAPKESTGGFNFGLSLNKDATKSITSANAAADASQNVASAFSFGSGSTDFNFGTKSDTSGRKEQIPPASESQFKFQSSSIVSDSKESLSTDTKNETTKKTTSKDYPPLSSSAPTPFSSLGQPAKAGQLSSAGYPPISSVGPTPFSAQSKTSLQPTDAKSKSSSSSSSYPPLASSAPTPFSKQSQTSNSKSAGSEEKVSASFSFGASSSSFSAQSKTSLQPAETKSKSSSSSGYPPLASSAPTPFGKQSQRSESKSTGSDEKVSTAFSFGTSSSSKTEGSKTLSVSSSSGYPPLSSSAPTPFSSLGQPAKAGQSSSAGYPPISTVGPTPFSAQSKTSLQPAETKSKSSSSSGYPPLASSAPTPFSKQSQTSESKFAGSEQKVSTAFSFGTSSSSKIEGSKTVSVSSSSGYPPLSSSAPTPFSSIGQPAKSGQSSSAGYPPISTVGPTPFSAQSKTSLQPAETKSKSSSSSGYPPLASSAPTPFSKQSQTSESKSTGSDEKVSTAFSLGTSSSSKTEGSKTLSVSSSSGYPPLSSSAPTPFSSIGQPVKAGQSSSAGYPPISTVGPTPFSAQSKTSLQPAETKSKSSSSSGYPPLASSAPTPFSKQSQTSESKFAGPVEKVSTAFSFGTSSSSKAEGSKTLSVSSSSGYPLLSSSAPTPFSSIGQPAKAGQSSSAGYPPISTVGPTPFSAQSKTSLQPAETKSKSSSSSGYPPLASNVPTPFNNLGTSSSDRSQASSTNLSSQPNFTSNQAGFKPTESDSGTQPFYNASSSSGPSSDLKLTPRRSKQRDLTDCTKQFIKVVELMNRSRSELSKRRPFAEDALKPEIERIRDMVNHILIKVGKIIETTEYCKDQSARILGSKVEASRKVAESERLVRRLLDLEDDKLSDIINNQPLDKDTEARRLKLAELAFSTTRLLEVARTRFHLLDHLDSPDAKRHILLSLTETFTRSKNLRDECVRIEKKVLYLNKGISQRPAAPAYSSRQLVRRGERIPASDAGSSKSRDLKKWADIDNSFVLLRTSKRKKFDIFKSSVSLLEDSQKTQDTSRLRPTDSQNSRQRANQLQFSPPISASVRSGWNDFSSVDQMGAKRLSLSVPKELKETTLDEAANSALSGFGVVPNRIKDAVSINDNVQRQIPLPVTMTKSITSSNKVESNKNELSRKIDLPTSSVSKPASTPTVDKSAKLLIPTQGSGNSTSASDAKLHNSAKGDTFTKQKPFPSSLDNLSILGNTLSLTNKSLPRNDSTDMPQEISSEPLESDDSPNYFNILVQFYQQHNPAKVSEAKNHLEKYKGRELELFTKLSQKYKVDNPLKSSVGQSNNNAKDTQATPLFSVANSFGGGTNSASTGQLAGQKSVFGSQSSIIPSFGSSTPNPPIFGSSTLSNTTTPAFGSSMISSSPFGGTSFASTTAPSTPFGGSAPVPSTPIGSKFSGRSPREMLQSFYQQYNPQKISEVDKLLGKYQGNEEQMFRNLAKKYNLDPSVFGLSSQPQAGPAGSATGMGTSTIASSPAGFGQPSALGGGPTFGAIAAPTSFGVGSFGSNTAASPGFGFGSLAQSPPTPGFGAFGATNSSPFGSSTPFGAPRR